MAKLTQAEIKAHKRAEELLAQERALNLDQIADVLSDWHEGARHSNAETSAFFTPFELAMNFAIEMPSQGRVLDLCAGIGMLSAAARIYHALNPGQLDLTLVELNPEYADIARRLLPDADVICGSVFDPAVQQRLREKRFDLAIGNPPFGRRNIANGAGPRYRGNQAEYAVIDIASDLADEGLFIIPQGSAPFRQSGRNYTNLTEGSEDPRYRAFYERTRVSLTPSIIDTSFADRLWRGTVVSTEIVKCDFVEARARRASSPLFGLAQAA